jgi:hypothetical protein
VKRAFFLGLCVSDASSNSPVSRREKFGLERVLTVAVLFALLAFYQWTIDPSDKLPAFDRGGNDHYNLLLRGWLKGQLAMDVAPDPVLDAMANPYDPAQRGAHGVHDASYFRGRHYLYFGATPVLLLHGPWHALTGNFIAPRYAVLFFAGCGWILAAWLWRSICRRADARGAVYWLGLLAIGAGNFVVPFLRRPDVWEIAIACAHALFMAALVCTWRALESPRRAWWFAGAGLALGLAIASRPVYLATGFVMLAPLWRAAQEAGWGSFWRRAGWWRLLAAGLAPLLVVGALMAWHNYARFGNPFESGHTYQLAGMEDHTKQSAFGGAFILYNLRLYLLTAPQFTAYFPFLTVANLPPAPAGYIGTEGVQGVLLGAPWALLGLALLVPRWRPRGVAGVWVATLALSGAGALLVLSTFGGSTNRYIVDFFPAWMLVGGVGALGLAGAFVGRGRRWVIAGCAALALWSATFNAMMSAQHNRLFEVLFPTEFERVARWANWLPWTLERMRGVDYGPLELRVVLPETQLGDVECLVATGRQFLADYLYVQRVDGHRIRFGFEHTAYGGGIGPFVDYLPGRENVIQIEMGSLYPPASHPYFRGMTPEQIARRKNQVRVLVNGREALALPETSCFEATEFVPSLGTSGPLRPAFKGDFSGRIVAQRRVPLTAEALAREETGPLRLIVELPGWTGPGSLPLVCSGRSGAGDLIFLQRVAENRIVIGHDHWGSGAIESEPIAIAAGEPLDFWISAPPLRRDGSTSGLVVKLNGRTLLDAPRDFHASAGPARIGVNAIGASTASPRFSGRIVSATRE